jgi:hypothetical protein
MWKVTTRREKKWQRDKLRGNLGGRRPPFRLQSSFMGVAVAGLIVAVIALIVSLGFNYLQYTWRDEEREERERGRTEAQTERAQQVAEQRRRERMPPEIYNAGGTSSPIRITGSQHSATGPFMDTWGSITVVNPTQAPMKITPLRLVVGGADWEIVRLAFHLKANDRERYQRLSMVGNDKQDYNLHFLFPENKVPKGMAGDLWLSSSNREGEPFSIPISFA